MRRLFWAVFLLSASFAETAAAETAAEAAVRWGLLGKWMPDCNAPVTRTNAAFNFAVRDGKLYLDREIGDIRDSSEMPVATVLTNGDLEMTTVFATATTMGKRVSILRRQDERHLLTWSNKAADTENYTIKDGKFLNGNPAQPALTRCGGPSS